MNELKELLESEILTDDTKEAIKSAVETVKENAISEARNNLEVEYAKKLEDEKSKLDEGMTSAINDLVGKEIAELKEDVEHARTLEIRYAEKLEEFKEEYANKLNEAMESKIGSLVEGEVKELKEDLDRAKEDNFGREIFEAFRHTFDRFGISEDMQELKAKMDATQKELAEAQKESARLQREMKVNELLEGLSGKKANVMRTILENVSTDKLEARYNETIDSVLNEGNGETDASKGSDNTREVLDENFDEEIERLRYLAGNRR